MRSCYQKQENVTALVVDISMYPVMQLLRLSVPGQDFQLDMCLTRKASSEY